MDKKAKILLVGFSAALVFVVFAGLGCANNSNTTNNNASSGDTQSSTETTQTPTTTSDNQSISATSTEDELDAKALQFAKDALSLYGTYNSDSDFSNLKQLEKFMTVDMIAKTEQKINDSAQSSTPKPNMYINVATEPSQSSIVDKSIKPHVWKISISALETRQIGENKEPENNLVTYSIGVTLATNYRLYISSIEKK